MEEDHNVLTVKELCDVLRAPPDDSLQADQSRSDPWFRSWQRIHKATLTHWIAEQSTSCTC